MEPLSDSFGLAQGSDEASAVLSAHGVGPPESLGRPLGRRAARLNAPGLHEAQDRSSIALVGVETKMAINAVSRDPPEKTSATRSPEQASTSPM